MPIYEFTCNECNNRFETLVLNSREKPQCPNCHSEKLEKMISAHAIGRSSPEAPACAPSACGTGACPACH